MKRNMMLLGLGLVMIAVPMVFSSLSILSLSFSPLMIGLAVVASVLLAFAVRGLTRSLAPKANAEQQRRHGEHA